jgi:3-deoxy-D-manno-octulosonate 8-phosphate phosphatase (KDO 8-P phosphatase)
MSVDFKRIQLLLLDVDGVMTDGRIIYDNHGGETKAFDVKDGHGLKLVQRAGIQVGIITGRESSVVDRRAKELGDDIVDLPILRQVGFAATVADAVDEVKAHVHLVARRNGGRGAVREICDLILQESGRWDAVTRHYFGN